MQVQRRIMLCGQHVLHDRRTKAAQAKCPRADPEAPWQLVSLRQVAQQAQHGSFESLEDFATAVRVTVKAICMASDTQQEYQSQHSECAFSG